MLGRSRLPGAVSPPEDDAVADDVNGPTPPPEDDLARSVEALLSELVEHQEKRLVALGQRLHPALSRDDMHNFDDVPALAGDPLFVYEDGLYAGLLAAQAALRSLLRRRRGPVRPDAPPGPDGPRDDIVSGPDDRAR